jgi:hypothetical protein
MESKILFDGLRPSASYFLAFFYNNLMIYDHHGYVFLLIFYGDTTIYDHLCLAINLSYRS